MTAPPPYAQFLDPFVSGTGMDGSKACLEALVVLRLCVVSLLQLPDPRLQLLREQALGAKQGNCGHWKTALAACAALEQAIPLWAAYQKLIGPEGESKDAASLADLAVSALESMPAGGFQLLPAGYTTRREHVFLGVVVGDENQAHVRAAITIQAAARTFRGRKRSCDAPGHVADSVDPESAIVGWLTKTGGRSPTDSTFAHHRGWFVLRSSTSKLLYFRHDPQSGAICLQARARAMKEMRCYRSARKAAIVVQRAFRRYRNSYEVTLTRGPDYILGDGTASKSPFGIGGVEL